MRHIIRFLLIFGLVWTPAAGFGQSSSSLDDLTSTRAGESEVDATGSENDAVKKKEIREKRKKRRRDRRKARKARKAKKSGAKKADSEKPGDKAELEKLEEQLSYPELEVTPRATDRLQMEAKREKKKRWVTHLPIQVSGLMTMIAASGSDHDTNVTVKEKDDFETAQSTASAIGTTWVLATVALSAWYRPYYRGYKEVSRLPKGKTKRDELTRERVAEESLYAPERLSKKLKWFSVVTNMYATVSLFENADSESEKNIGLAALASLLPLVFEYRWASVAKQHRTYKKKIYGPVATSFLYRDENHSLKPGLALNWSF